MIKQSCRCERRSGGDDKNQHEVLSFLTSFPTTLTTKPTSTRPSLQQWQRPGNPPRQTKAIPTTRRSLIKTTQSWTFSAISSRTKSPPKQESTTQQRNSQSSLPVPRAPWPIHFRTSGQPLSNSMELHTQIQPPADLCRPCAATRSWSRP
jgi:hypothetical protein